MNLKLISMNNEYEKNLLIREISIIESEQEQGDSTKYVLYSK